jgi:hypothetical protein
MNKKLQTQFSNKWLKHKEGNYKHVCIPLISSGKECDTWFVEEIGDNIGHNTVFYNPTKDCMSVVTNDDNTLLFKVLYDRLQNEVYFSSYNIDILSDCCEKMNIRLKDIVDLYDVFLEEFLRIELDIYNMAITLEELLSFKEGR